jgi:hypothetical protein
MAFDLAQIKKEAAAAPIESPIPADLAVAIVNDCFRMAGIRPVEDATWLEWTTRPKSLVEEQLGMLAHLLTTTSLRENTVAAIAAAKPEPTERMEAFLAAVAPLTAEMIRANVFRQEEFLRRWIESWQGEILGESAEQSQNRLEQLDYRQTLAEYGKAERARREEAKRREKLLREAQEREAAARGWRE